MAMTTTPTPRALPATLNMRFRRRVIGRVKLVADAHGDERPVRCAVATVLVALVRDGERERDHEQERGELEGGERAPDIADDAAESLSAGDAEALHRRQRSEPEAAAAGVSGVEGGGAPRRNADRVGEACEHDEVDDDERAARQCEREDRDGRNEQSNDEGHLAAVVVGEVAVSPED